MKLIILGLVGFDFHENLGLRKVKIFCTITMTVLIWTIFSVSSWNWL